MTSEFNIIRELYLNKDNRNTINELIKHLDRKTMRSLMRLIFDNESLCTNCFKVGLYNGIPKCQRDVYYVFCDKCYKEHLDKYTEFLEYKKSSWTYNREPVLSLIYKHKCDVGETTICNKIDKNNFEDFIINCTALIGKPSYFLWRFGFYQH